jgi:HD-GYP domain-containing protein (c-di-GMP phosphodiesterase class II)
MLGLSIADNEKILEDCFAGYGKVGKETVEHSKRVGQLLQELLVYHKIQNPNSQEGYLAGVDHDIGKSGIEKGLWEYTLHPDERQLRLIKYHPQKGEDILRGIEKKFGPLHPWIHKATFSHHEQYDGHGYPMRIARKEIPLIAGLVHIVDEYDASTTRPHYSSRGIIRPPLTKEQAVMKIEEAKGTKYDPTLVNMFLQYLRSR